MTLKQNAREVFAWSFPPDERSPKKPDQNQDAGDSIGLRAELKFELKLVRIPGTNEILLDIPLVPLFDPPEDYSKDGTGKGRRRLLKKFHTEHTHFYNSGTEINDTSWISHRSKGLSEETFSSAMHEEYKQHPGHHSVPPR